MLVRLQRWRREANQKKDGDERCSSEIMTHALERHEKKKKKKRLQTERTLPGDNSVVHHIIYFKHRTVHLFLCSEWSCYPFVILRKPN